MTVGSLFAGIGGFDAGFERAGFEVCWQVEREPFCQRVLSARFGAARIYDDVTTVGASNLEPVDVLVGGFPCQDVSVAGKRAGLAGSRSNLFYEFARIAMELQMEWVVIENVPGLFSSRNGRDVSAILETLWECGYLDGAYRVLDSRWFGVAQRRRRCFFVAHRGNGGRAGAVLFESESGARDSQTGQEAGPRVAATLRGHSHGVGVNMPGRGGEDDVNLVCFDWQSGGDVRHNYSCGADDNQAQANHLIVSTLAGNSGRNQIEQNYIPAVAFTENMRGELRETEYANALSIGGGKPGQGYPAARTAEGVRRLTPLECERLQGFPDGWTCLCGVTPYSTQGCTCSDSARYRALGNAVTVNVAEWIARRLREVA